jgi:hypothetical protein
VLGPPKTNFASSSAPRQAGKPFDHNGTPREEYLGSKAKYNEDREKGEGRDEKSKEARTMPLQGQKNGRDEGESRSGVRLGKNLGSEDHHRAVRRTEGDNDAETAEKQNSNKAFDNYRRQGSRDTDDGRRNGMGRGKPLWYRDDDSLEGQVLDTKGEITGVKNWRDGEKGNHRGFEKEWNKGGKIERDPEWMLDPRVEEKKPSHTADDFEQWRASMKAQGSADQNVPAVVNVPLGHTRTASGNTARTRKAETSLELEPALQKFFWNEDKDNTDSGTPHTEGSEDRLKQGHAKVNAPKSSRFTGFFNPAPKATLPELEPMVNSRTVQVPLSNDSSNDDKVGFQRILQMLGGTNVVGGDSQQLNKPLQPSFMEQQTTQGSQNRTPPREHTPANLSASPQILSPRSRKSIGLENLLGNQISREAPQTQNSDSEFLLNLMRPKGFEMKQPMPRAHIYQGANAPGLLPHPNLIGQPQMSHHNLDESSQLNFYDDHSIENRRPRDKLNPGLNRDPRVPRGARSGDFDNSEEAPPQYQSHMGIPARFALPPGLHGPSGFDQMLPPGYNQPMPPQQRPTMIGPPPGFPSRSSGVNPFPPGLIPNLSNLSLTTDRGAPFGVRQMVPGPGALPPPGYMGIGAPPPGFLPPAMPKDVAMSPSGRMFFGGGPQRGGPTDMFGETGPFVNGGRGSGGMPGQFRRHE